MCAEHSAVLLVCLRDRSAVDALVSGGFGGTRGTRDAPPRVMRPAPIYDIALSLYEPTPATLPIRQPQAELEAHAIRAASLAAPGHTSSIMYPLTGL